MSTHIRLYKTSRGPFGWSPIMRSVPGAFNTLFAAILLAGLAACSTGSSKQPKPLKHIRIHVESRHDIPERALQAEVGRVDPLKFTVEKLPILTEIHVERAALLDQHGGFQLQLKFDTLGSRILESYTSAAAGRHLLVLTDIDGVSHWIAAPVIRGRIGDGTLAFSPIASREDMERLVRGLNKEVEKRKRQWLD